MSERKGSDGSAISAMALDGGGGGGAHAWRMRSGKSDHRRNRACDECVMVAPKITTPKSKLT